MPNCISQSASPILLYTQIKTGIGTVEQEFFATGNFRDFRPQAISMQEIFANFWLEELLSFKMSPSRAGNFRESADFREIIFTV